MVIVKDVAHIFPVSGDHNHQKKELNFSEQFLNESLLISSLCNMKNISFVPCEYIENLNYENKNALSKR